MINDNLPQLIYFCKPTNQCQSLTFESHPVRSRLISRNTPLNATNQHQSHLRSYAGTDDVNPLMSLKVCQTLKPYIRLAVYSFQENYVWLAQFSLIIRSKFGVAFLFQILSSDLTTLWHSIKMYLILTKKIKKQQQRW